MNASQSHKPEEKTVQVDLLECIRTNNRELLQRLVDNNFIVYDMIIADQTLLHYAQNTPGVEPATCNIFLLQQRFVEWILNQLEDISKILIYSPEKLTEEDINLYKISKSLRNELFKIIIKDKEALQSMQEENSVLKKIFPDFDYLAELKKMADVEETKKNITLARTEKNDIYLTSVRGFDDPELKRLANNPVYMKKFIRDLRNAFIPDLINYLIILSASYSPLSPISLLFEKYPCFTTADKTEVSWVEACKMKVIDMENRVTDFLDELKEVSLPELSRYITVISRAYETIDPEFLKACQTKFDKFIPHKQIQQKNYTVWNAVQDDNLSKLNKLMLEKDFDLSNVNPFDKNYSGETLLHFAITLNRPHCLSKIIDYIKIKKLDYLYLAKKKLPEQKSLVTPAGLAFVKARAEGNACFSLLLNASAASRKECERIVSKELHNLKDQNTHPELFLIILNSFHFSLHHTAILMKFNFLDNNPKYLEITPAMDFYDFILNNRPEMETELNRRNALFQKAKTNDTQFGNVFFEDLKLLDENGKSLFEVAQESKSDKVLTALTEFKKQEGFAHQIKTIGCVGLYQKIINGSLAQDSEFLAFISSKHLIAHQARMDLYEWLLDSQMTKNEFIKSGYPDFDKILNLFKTIYQHETVLTYIEGRLTQAKSIYDKHHADCKNADEIFYSLQHNDVDKELLASYVHNLELIKIIKNKIIHTEDCQEKSALYLLIFPDYDQQPKPQLFTLFNWYLFDPEWESLPQKKMIDELEKDMLEFTKKMNKEIEDEERFERAVQKLIQQAKPNRTLNQIPMTTLTNKSHSHANFFKMAEQVFSPLATPSTDPLKKLANHPSSLEVKDHDELDEKILRANV